MKPTMVIRRTGRPAVTAGMLVAVLAAASCLGDADRPAAVGPGGSGPSALVIAPPTTQDSIDVEVYVDATHSMVGYLAGGNTSYIRFLEEFEGAVRSGWSREQLSYFRFGGRQVPVRREQFVASARAPAFYTERGIAELTQIERVAGCAEGNALRVVVTDLFQDEGDINMVVDRIKEECFRRGRAVGVLAIPSHFDGMIYDARVPGYRYASVADQPESFRPFYAVISGGQHDVERLIRALPSDAASFDKERFLLVAPYAVQEYAVGMRKSPDSRDINLTGSRPQELRHEFRMKKGGTAATLLADVDLTLIRGTADFQLERLQLVVRKQPLARGGAEAGEPVETQDIRLRESTREGNRLHLVLDLQNTDPAGSYLYELELRSGATRGFAVPAWVAQLSSDDPRPGSEPNRTYNLSRFVNDLMGARSSVHAPVLAAWHVALEKR
jgi:hypothetical protein